MTAAGGAMSVILPLTLIAGASILIALLTWVGNQRQTQRHAAHRRNIDREALRARERFDDVAPGLLVSLEEERAKRQQRAFERAGYITWPSSNGALARASSQPAARESNGAARIEPAGARTTEDRSVGRGER
jgi:hypothetical protein